MSTLPVDFSKPYSSNQASHLIDTYDQNGNLYDSFTLQIIQPPYDQYTEYSIPPGAPFSEVPS